jgi:soluble lytic murein transglycosylase-like protein
MENKYDDLIKIAVNQYLPFLDWRLYKAQLWQESRFKPAAVSPVGARGVAQVMPGTWAEWAPRAGYKNADPFDPQASIQVGACYLAYLHSQWHSPRPAMDRVCLAMASYNAGLGSLLRAQQRVKGALAYRDIIRGLHLVTGEHSQETINYVRNILEFYNKEITG